MTPQALIAGLVVFCAVLGFSCWLGAFLADAREFMEREEAGLCTCSRHRLCASCMAALREPKPETTKEAA